MWCYVKTLQYPVNLKCSDLSMAKLLITQFGGPDGELSAALRYLSQRFSMPTNKSKCMLNDIGTEEMAHVEIIATMVHQIMENSTIDEIKKAGLAGHYADHGKGVYPTDATGNPWSATFFQSKGDVIADLHENLAAEQKARATYEWLLNLTDDYEIKKILGFLREREVVHYQRFGETLMHVQENLSHKNPNCK